MNKPKAIICDIDDTIVEPANKYKPIQNVIDFLIQQSQTYKIIMLTARYEKMRDFTVQQLRELGIPFDMLIMEQGDHENHYAGQTMEHGIYKAAEVQKLLKEYDIVLFIDNSRWARKNVKQLSVTTKKPENISNKILTKTAWNGIFI